MKTTIEIYPVAYGFRWRMVAANGHLLTKSEDVYSRRRDCKQGARRLVKRLASGLVTIRDW